MIINDALLVNVGTYGTCLDKNTGDIIWQTGGAAGYSSMMPYVRDGQRGGAVRGDCSLIPNRKKRWVTRGRQSTALTQPTRSCWATWCSSSVTTEAAHC